MRNKNHSCLRDDVINSVEAVEHKPDITPYEDPVDY